MKRVLAFTMFISSWTICSAQQIIELTFDSSEVIKTTEDWNDTLYIPNIEFGDFVYRRPETKVVIKKEGHIVTEMTTKGDSVRTKHFYSNGKLRAVNIENRVTLAWLYKEYYYSNGQLWKKLILTPDTWYPLIEYWENGNIKLKANYYSGAYWGSTTGYFENGNIEFEGSYKPFPSNYKGLGFTPTTREGKWNYYDSKGKLTKKVEFKNNKEIKN
jgi:antitoxin component YwqK of YwqJK toxin-antitoxin module